jgi:hypothetical protein
MNAKWPKGHADERGNGSVSALQHYQFHRGAGAGTCDPATCPAGLRAVCAGRLRGEVRHRQIGAGAAPKEGKANLLSQLEIVAPGGRTQDPGYSLRRHRHPIGSPLRFQPVPRALLDQEIDQLQPAGLVDRLGQQPSITCIIVARFVLRHRTPPYATPTRKLLFPNRRRDATELRNLSPWFPRPRHEPGVVINIHSPSRDGRL